jgi:hypothetical protein
MPRYFTLPEARAALKAVQPLVSEILEIRGKLLARRPEVWGVVERAAGNGGSAAASKLVVEFERLDSLIHQIQDMGVLLKDINTGLLDFPHLRDGREVYLCWQYGEEGIEFWHEIEAGYAGRQPLE